MILYCATENAGKLREFHLAARFFDAAWARIEVLPGLNRIPPPEETGTTFRDNAVLKATYYSRFATEYVFSDDSGLAVDALGGAPGVHSARYSGHDATAASNNALLLERMRSRTGRSARFVCVIALARGGHPIATFEGFVEGELLDAPRGSGGFGYDPLFLYPPYGQTLAEVDEARKMQVSHRGKALEALLAYLRNAGGRDELARSSATR